MTAMPIKLIVESVEDRLEHWGVFAYVRVAEFGVPEPRRGLVRMSRPLVRDGVIDWHPGAVVELREGVVAWDGTP